MLKDLLRQVTPPFLFALARGLVRRVKLGQPMFDGLYAEPSLLPPATGNPFEHPNWLSYVADRARSRIDGVAYQDMNEMCLSLIASITPAGASSAFRHVVDFGGGVGMYWPVLKVQNRTGAKLRFVVVDSPGNCKLGLSLFGADGVEFLSDFEQLLARGTSIDVLNVSSTLQYCLNYETVVELLCRSKARFIIVSRHPAPIQEQPVAYTMQNVVTVNGFCGRIPVVLLSIEPLSRLMSQHGYGMIADYYNDADASKYWTYGKQPIPAGFSQIAEHALVFQRLPDNSPAATAAQAPAASS